MFLEVLLEVIDVEDRHGKTKFDIVPQYDMLTVCDDLPNRGQGVRGGRNSERKTEANADDLDKDLEAYLKVSQPHRPKPKRASLILGKMIKAPAADEVRAKDGDVDMS